MPEGSPHVMAIKGTVRSVVLKGGVMVSLVPTSL